MLDPLRCISLSLPWVLRFLKDNSLELKYLRECYKWNLMPLKWGSSAFDHRRLPKSLLWRVFVFTSLNEGLQTSSAWMHRYESAGRNFLGIPAFRSLSLYCWSSFFILLWYSCRVPAKQKVITSKRHSICDNIFLYQSCVWIKKTKTKHGCSKMTHAETWW